MRPRILIMALLLVGIFFLTYWAVVGSPFATDRLDFRACFTGLLDTASDSTDFPVSKLAITVIVLGFGRVVIWLFQQILDA